jgi:hypothetical protein
LKEAEAMLVHFMQAQNNVLGKKHPDTLSNMAILAHTFKSQGQDDQAVAYMQNVVISRKDILDFNHL